MQKAELVAHAVAALAVAAMLYLIGAPPAGLSPLSGMLIVLTLMVTLATAAATVIDRRSARARRRARR